MSVQTTMKYHLLLTRMAKLKKQDYNKCWQEGREFLSFWALLVERQNNFHFKKKKVEELLLKDMKTNVSVKSVIMTHTSRKVSQINNTLPTTTTPCQ